MKGKKLVCVFVTMLMITCSVTILLNQNNIKIVAAEGEQKEIPNNTIGLNYTYFWDVTTYISNAVHNAYNNTQIPKGRAFGSKGCEVYTKDYIYLEMNDSHRLNLSDVKVEKLGPLANYTKRYYASMMDVVGYKLTIERNGYNYPRNVPWSECFAIPSGIIDRLTHEMTHNYTMNETSDVRVTDIKHILDSWWPINGTLTNEYKNVTCSSVNDLDFICGNASLIDNSSELSVDQTGYVFLVNETDGCEEILDNITNASAAILLHSEEKGNIITDGSKYSFPLERIDANDENLTNITERLRNGETILADNLYNESIITFTCGLWDLRPWPDYNFTIIQKLNTTTETIFGKPATKLHSLGYWLTATSFLFWLGNGNIHKYKCKGIIIYSEKNDGTHLMTMDNEGWMPGGSFPCLPAYSVNLSVGSFLDQYLGCSNNTVSGFINQTYYDGKTNSTGINAYDIVGHINIPKSPNNSIVLISNRHDSWWGECSSDSGAGAGIVLGIAKYFKEHHITPKYNLTFLQTTGEEFGYRGAQYYSDNHSDENVILFIGADQLGMKEARTILELKYKTNDTRRIVWAIANDTYYEERTGYEINHSNAFEDQDPDNAWGDCTDDHVWKQRNMNNQNLTQCDTICLGKEKWSSHHQTGMNFTEGDSLKNTDRNDLNVSFELAWNMTKYFTVNPDCWFSNISFTAFDSPNDGDTLNDSIRTNFTIHSVLPSDKVRVELDLGYEIGGSGGDIQNAGNADYTLTSRSQNESYIFTIPDTVVDGNYSVSFKLYNSTGRINKIVYGSSGTYYNDTTENSSWSHLYHPLGYTKRGSSYKCVHDNISGSVFTANEDGRADNIIAFINQNYMSPGPYECMLYRASDGALIGNTTSDWVSLPQGNPESSSWWAVFNFTGNKSYLVKGTQYVITCWGDSAYSRVYYNGSDSSETGRYDNQLYGNPPNPANFTNESRYYSIYCSYTPDVTPPQITNVIANPHTVGFGYNVTISTNVTAHSGVNLVKVQIHAPGSSPEMGNYTMTHISGDTYQYVFLNAWTVGQYNYTIWAVSNSSHVNRSTGHHFHVSADATISIATLQDSYSGNEYINITDPPNPPENLTLVARGLTWDKFYNAVTGQNILKVSTGPVNYQDENHTWTPINTTIGQLAPDHPAYMYGYRTGNNRGLYGVYFKSNMQNDWPVAFTYNRSDDPTIYAVRSKLLGVGYVDPQSNWTYQYLQNVQSSQGQTSSNSITFEGVFTGTDVTWSYGNTGLKEEITLSNATKIVLQNHPPSMYGLNNASSYLVFITKLEHHDLNLYNTSGMLTENATISDAGVDFKDALDQFTCALPRGEAYELNNESVRQKLTYRIVHLNGNTYLLSGLKVSDLTAMTFPVIIDPTITVNASISDGYIYQSDTNYSTAWSASEGIVSSDDKYLSIGQTGINTSLDYYIYRGFLFFDTSELPANANIKNATLSLYKKDDYSATDFTITVQNGQPTYPHDPLEKEDYDQKYYSGNGGGLNTTNFTNGRNNLTLTNFSWITTGDITKLCLRSSRDINGNTPTGNEYVTVYASEQEGCQPMLVIIFSNQSKIKNTGSTDIKGYLLIQVQYNDSGSWVLDSDTVDETPPVWQPRLIKISEQLSLDTIFNGKVRASDLQHGEGMYRVYTAFRDSEGHILRTNDGTWLEAWWQFSKT